MFKRAYSDLDGAASLSTSSYLYVGKSLNSKDIAELEEITAMSTLLNYALSIVSKKHISEKEMLEKLLKKEDRT